MKLDGAFICVRCGVWHNFNNFYFEKPPKVDFGLLSLSKKRVIHLESVLNGTLGD